VENFDCDARRLDSASAQQVIYPQCSSRVDRLFHAIAGNIAWDPSYHGSMMMVPVVFVTWLMVVLAVVLASYLAVMVAQRTRMFSSSLIKRDPSALE